MTTDLVDLIAAATAARTRLLDAVDNLSTTQGAFKADPAEWSIAENVEHLVVAEQGCINRVWAAAEGLRQGQRAWAAEPVHRGKPIEQVVNETWAPRQTAPDIATPRRRGPLGYWITALRCNQPILEALPAALAGLDPAEVITPHPISGPWDACQWLAFVRFHLDLHRQQIDDVARAPGFPR
jgi:hypothetical protein